MIINEDSVMIKTGNVTGKFILVGDRTFIRLHIGVWLTKRLDSWDLTRDEESDQLEDLYQARLRS